MACAGNLQLIKYDKFWGEGDTPLPDLPQASGSVAAAGAGGAGGAGVTPLGELEFVLDREARSESR